MTHLKKIWKVIMVIVLLILILIFILVMLLLQTTRHKKYDEQIALGDKYLTQQDYEQAELCFKRAMNISDKVAEPYIKLADVYRETGDLEKAVSVMQSGSDSGEKMSEQQREILESYANEIQAVAREPEDAEKPSGSDKKVTGDVKAANENDNEDLSDDAADDGGNGETAETPPVEDDIFSNDGDENTGAGDETGGNPNENTGEDADVNRNSEIPVGLNKIIQDTTSLSYIGDMGYGITAVYSGGPLTCNPIGASGYIAAHETDYDGDGAKEILVIALQGGEISGVKQDVFCLYMLKQEGQSWGVQDSYAIGSESADGTDNLGTVLRSNTFPARIQFFVNQTGSSTDIFMEITSKAIFFDDRAPYGIQKYTYSGDGFSCSGPEIWVDNLDSNEPPPAEVLQNLNTWGIQAGVLGYGSETMVQNAVAVPLVKVDKVSLSSEIIFGGGDWSQPHENMGRLVFTDYSDTKSLKAAAPGTVNLLDIPLGISREEFHETWKPVLEAAQAAPEEETETREVYTLTKEVFYPEIPLKVEFIFENNKLVNLGFSSMSSDDGRNADDTRFIEECTRRFSGQPEVFTFEGALYSWYGVSERADLIGRPGIIQFSRWDNTLGQNFALSLE